jgi:aminoglycoside phosphotransferase (APT) family kinase protein
MARAEIPGVDLAALAHWMDGQGLGGGAITDPTPLTGGTQNILIRFCRSGREYVLRRPPLHKRAHSDETIRREARVLAALAGSAVPHPGLIAACPDPGPLGAAFYLMKPVSGICPAISLPEPLRSSPEIQHHLGLAMAAGIAALALVDLQTPGLDRLGRPDGWLQRQVGRWRAQFDSYGSLDGYPGPRLPGIDAVGRWLDEHLPARWTPGLLHFGNVLVDPASGALTAIVDWELATVGDPLLDLGHLLATWPTHYPVGGGIDAPHLPDVGTVTAHYAALTGRSTDEIAWYRVLACYRFGIILEGSHARAFAGQTSTEIGDRLHHRAELLFQQARWLTDEGPGATSAPTAPR